MNISIACDHGGLELKEQIKQHLLDNGHTVVDCGTNSTDSCDYPDYAELASQKVAQGECQFGVVVCTTGIGVSIVANKVKGVRCALCQNVDMAKMTRLHNNSNMIAFGAKYTDQSTAYEMVDTFIATPFEGGRHQRRIDKITAIENK